MDSIHLGTEKGETRGDTSFSTFQSRSEARAAIYSFLQLMKQQYRITLQEVIHEFNGVSEDVPVSIFCELSPAEALCKYLKENRGYSLHQIGELLGRDERGIWSTHNRAKKKHPARFTIDQSLQSIFIPLFLFSDRRLSILEHVVLHLYSTLLMTTNQIAKLLKKKQAVVHTTLQRALQKKNNNKHDAISRLWNGRIMNE